jgi:acetyl esterase/lipase
VTTGDRRWYRRPSRAVPAALLALGIVAAVVWVASPWPAALLIRGLFEKGAADTVSEMKPFVPATGVSSKRNISYGNDGSNTTLDLFSPSGTTSALLTVVWIHGGAWISGQKQDVDPYVEILASHGYTTVSLNYTISPEATYPTAMRQLNAALGFLVRNAAKYNIDPTRIILAGDSAGAQLASELANLTTNPAFATAVGITPALSTAQLRAVILNCGIYDVSEIPNAPGIGGWGFRIALWAYQGTKDWSHTKAGAQMSSIDYVTSAFPQTWISGGNDDPLTASQSEPLATKLTKLGVPVTSVFYPDDHVPALPHEYQFHLKLADARSALDSTLAFLKAVSA